MQVWSGVFFFYTWWNGNTITPPAINKHSNIGFQEKMHIERSRMTKKQNFFLYLGDENGKKNDADGGRENDVMIGDDG